MISPADRSTCWECFFKYFFSKNQGIVENLLSLLCDENMYSSIQQTMEKCSFRHRQTLVHKSIHSYLRDPDAFWVSFWLTEGNQQTIKRISLNVMFQTSCWRWTQETSKQFCAKWVKTETFVHESVWAWPEHATTNDRWRRLHAGLVTTHRTRTQARLRSKETRIFLLKEETLIPKFEKKFRITWQCKSPKTRRVC